MNHDLYKTGDADAPDAIKDRNGEVALDLCRRCGKTEIDLVPGEPCEGAKSEPPTISRQTALEALAALSSADRYIQAKLHTTNEARSAAIKAMCDEMGVIVRERGEK